MEGVASNSGNHSPLAQSCCGSDANLGFLNFTMTLKTDRVPFKCYFSFYIMEKPALG